jgi:hypothetical protein
MTINTELRWSLGRGKTLVPSRWQATLRLYGSPRVPVVDVVTVLTAT